MQTIYCSPSLFCACGFHGNEIASVLSDLHEQGSGACQGLKSADGLWSMPKKRERQRMRDRVEKKRKGVIKCRLKEEWDEADFAGKRFVFGFSGWLARR